MEYFEKKILHTLEGEAFPGEAHWHLNVFETARNRSDLIIRVEARLGKNQFHGLVTMDLGVVDPCERIERT